MIDLSVLDEYAGQEVEADFLRDPYLPGNNGVISQVFRGVLNRGNGDFLSIGFPMVNNIPYLGKDGTLWEIRSDNEKIFSHKPIGGSPFTRNYAIFKGGKEVLGVLEGMGLFRSNLKEHPYVTPLVLKVLVGENEFLSEKLIGELFRSWKEKSVIIPSEKRFSQFEKDLDLFLGKGEWKIHQNI